MVGDEKNGGVGGFRDKVDSSGDWMADVGLILLNQINPLMSPVTQLNCYDTTNHCYSL